MFDESQAVAGRKKGTKKKVSGAMSCVPGISGRLLHGDVRLHRRIAICVKAFSRARR